MAKVNKSVVRLDDPRFANTDVYSVRSANALQNGFVGKLGEVEDGNRDIRELKDTATGDSIVLVANPALPYDNARLGSAQETDYEMEANEAVRAYGVKPTFVFSVSKEAIEGAAVVDQYLVAGAGNKLVPLAALLGSETGFVGKVVRKDKVGGALSLVTKQEATEYIVIDTIQN